MQADAIPDWFIYILFTPFFPMGFAVHYILGIFQCILFVLILIWTIIICPRRKMPLLGSLLAVYGITIIIPNIAVVIWGIITDPCLWF